jgi:hypothetical protein
LTEKETGKPLPGFEYPQIKTGAHWDSVRARVPKEESLSVKMVGYRASDILTCLKTNHRNGTPKTGMDALENIKMKKY